VTLIVLFYEGQPRDVIGWRTAKTSGTTKPCRGEGARDVGTAAPGSTTTRRAHNPDASFVTAVAERESPFGSASGAPKDGGDWDPITRTEGICTGVGSNVGPFLFFSFFLNLCSFSFFFSFFSCDPFFSLWLSRLTRPLRESEGQRSRKNKVFFCNL